MEGWFGPASIGQYIRADLMLLDGGLVQYVDGVWEWVDWYNSGVTYLGWSTYLGGAELLAQGCVGSACGFVYSPDLGASWQLRATDPDFRVMAGPWHIGNKVVLVPGIPYNTGEGWVLYRSTDKGSNWERISPVTGGTNAYDQWVVDYMWWNQVEGEGSVILAAGGAYTGEFSTCGLWKSTDEGQTWRHLSTLADDCNAHAPVRSIAIDPQGNALMIVGPYQNYFLYKSRDAGETWELIAVPDGGSPYGVMYLGNNLETP